MKSSFYEWIGQKIRPIELATLIKKLLLIKRRVYELHGNYFFIDPVSNFGLRIMRDREYEPETAALITNTLQIGDTFIDLGANEGYFSILASKIVGKTGKVLCIEPQKRLWPVIVRNIELNRCINIQLLPFVVSNESKDVQLVLSPSNNTGSTSIVTNNRNQMWTRQKVESIILDDAVLSEKINLIKIDIEGFELFALKGGKRLLENRVIEYIILELHPRQLIDLGQSEEEVNSFLNELGYFLHDGLYQFISKK